MTPIDGLSFQLYFRPHNRVAGTAAVRNCSPGLGYKKVEPFGGLFGEPPKAQRASLERHGMSAPISGMSGPSTGCGADSGRSKPHVP